VGGGGGGGVERMALTLSPLRSNPTKNFSDNFADPLIITGRSPSPSLLLLLLLLSDL